MEDLSQRSDDDLLAGVARLVVSQRRLTVELVVHLAEIEERRLHLLAGFSSMFDFCQKKLGMSEGEAFRRIVAARLGQRFPVVHRLLASGAVHLSTLELLRERLTDENHAELLAAVAGKGKREVQAILAARFPRPDDPSRIVKQASIEPLSEARFHVEFTASEDLVRKLELCRDLMSHANPSRELGVVIERAVDLFLRVRCRSHNQLWAEQAFGRRHVELEKHFRQRKWSSTQSPSDAKCEVQRARDGALELPTNVFEKARLALCKMGFRADDARRAIASVHVRHAGEPQTLELVLREALFAATTKAA